MCKVTPVILHGVASPTIEAFETVLPWTVSRPCGGPSGGAALYERGIRVGRAELQPLQAVVELICQTSNSQGQILTLFISPNS